MKMLRLSLIALFLSVSFTLGATSALAAESTPQADQQALRGLLDKYTEAYNSGNATAAADLWTADAVFNHHVAGAMLKGRPEIEKYLAGLFAGEQRGTLSIAIGDSQLVAPSVAVLSTVGTLKEAGLPPQDTTGTVVAVRRNGQWLMDRVSVDLAASADVGADELAKLGWMVGSWMYEAENQLRVETTAQWTPNRQFLSRSFRVFRGNEVLLTGTELIGFDRAKQTISSCDYNSDGSHGDAVWTKNGNTWSARQTGILANGDTYTAVNIIRYVNDNAFVFQATNRVLNGRAEPDTREVLVARTGTIDTTSDAE